MLAPPGQHRIEQQPDELQCEVFEGERRTVKQLEQPQPLVELHQRSHRRVAEPFIGYLGKPPQLVGGKVVARKQRNEPGRELGIGQAGIVPQNRFPKRRQPVRHVKSAIPGQAGQKHLYEREGGRRGAGIAGTEIAQGSLPIEMWSLSPLPRPRNPTRVWSKEFQMAHRTVGPSLVSTRGLTGRERAPSACRAAGPRPPVAASHILAELRTVRGPACRA